MTIRYIKEVGRNPQIDWIVIVALSVLVGLSLVVGSIYLYKAVTQGNIQGASSETLNATKTIDKKIFSTVISIFSRKEEMSRKAISGYAGPDDPSK